MGRRPIMLKSVDNFFENIRFFFILLQNYSCKCMNT